MMNFVKIAGILALCVLLNGCSFESKFKEPAPTEPTVTESPQSTEQAETTVSTVPPSEPIPETEPETAPLSPREIYRGLLSNLLANGEIAGHSVEGNISENQFAIADIDSDDREELIVRVTNPEKIYKKFEIVLDVDKAGNPFEELREFPNITYYSNGNATALLSHSQGFSGDFPPYTLYQYDNNLDGFAQVVTVSAMDKKLMEEMEVADIYPEDADTSHSGFVYYIGSDNPVDVTEYENWCQSWQNHASVLEIPFQTITEEHIKNIQ